MKTRFCLVAFLFVLGAFAVPAAVSATTSQSCSACCDAKKEYKSVKFEVSIECENCVKKVMENISFEKGVKGLDVSLDDKTVTVTYDPTKTDEEKLAEAIRKLGYTVNGK